MANLNDFIKPDGTYDMDAYTASIQNNLASQNLTPGAVQAGLPVAPSYSSGGAVNYMGSSGADYGNKYFQANPDVAAAYANRYNDPNLASTVNMSPDEFAQIHFSKFGQNEQRAAPTASPVVAATPAAANIPTINGYQVDPSSALGSLGAANPTDAISRMLSGKVNTDTLDPVVNNAMRRLSENFNEQVMPGINQGATAAGQYGGSRQGIAQGLAAKGLAYAQGDMSANLYNQAYQQAQQQMYGTASNMANLGFSNAQSNANRDLAAQTANASNALTKYGMDQGFYTNNRGLDLQQMQVGANLFNMGNTGMTNQGQGVYNTGTTYQNAPWNTVSNMNSAVTPYTGYGTTSQATQGSTAGGVLGGALMGSQLYKNLGFGTAPNGTANPYGANLMFAG